jgi:hypothetical protein
MPADVDMIVVSVSLVLSTPEAPAAVLLVGAIGFAIFVAALSFQAASRRWKGPPLYLLVGAVFLMSFDFGVGAVYLLARRALSGLGHPRSALIYGRIPAAAGSRDCLRWTITESRQRRLR